MLLHTGVFGHGFFWPLYTETLAHKFSYAEMLFRQKRIYTEAFLTLRYFCKEVFLQGYRCTEVPLYTGGLDQGDSRQGLLHGQGWKNLSILTCTFTHT